MTTIELMPADKSYDVDVSGWINERSYRCHLAIVREDEGDFSVIVLNLPGAGSCGDTEDEAIENTKEAIRGVIESYGSERIPWMQSTNADIPDGATLKWVLVDVQA